MPKYFYFFLTILLLASGCQKTQPIVKNTASENQTSNAEAASSPPVLESPMLTMPIANGLESISKKPFGIYITPQNSPVSPEKFKGYHTGTDFETFEDEQNIEVPIFAVCDGKLILKKYASGYGGVIVQSCQLDGQNVTVLYGHLKLASITLKVGDAITAGQQLGVRGDGYSAKTDSERKHLHLSNHKGTEIVLLGYVQNEKDLSQWLNPTDYFK